MPPLMNKACRSCLWVRGTRSQTSKAHRHCSIKATTTILSDRWAHIITMAVLNLTKKERREAGTQPVWTRHRQYPTTLALWAIATTSCWESTARWTGLISWSGRLQFFAVATSHQTLQNAHKHWFKNRLKAIYPLKKHLWSSVIALHVTKLIFSSEN